MRKKRDFRFDRRAAAYDDGFEGKFSARFYRLLLRNVALQPGAAVLDVGCGTGTVLQRMNERLPIDGCGIDLEENMIAEAAKKCPSMQMLVSSCTETPFSGGRFDVITACMAYHHFADQKGFAKEAARLLKAGGCLYIADPRFPWAVRKPLNLAFRLHRIAGRFDTAAEIARDFAAYGFALDGFQADGYAQVVKLRKAA